MTDSIDPQKNTEQHAPLDLGLLEEVLRAIGLMPGSGLDQLFTTFGARFVPVEIEATTTGASLEKPSGIDHPSYEDDADFDPADRSDVNTPDDSMLE